MLHSVKEFFNAPSILAALPKFTVLLVWLMACLFIVPAKVIIQEENALNFKGSQWGESNRIYGKCKHTQSQQRNNWVLAPLSLLVAPFQLRAFHALKSKYQGSVVRYSKWCWCLGKRGWCSVCGRALALFKICTHYLLHTSMVVCTDQCTDITAGGRETKRSIADH